jgi:hypothetical protein
MFSQKSGQLQKEGATVDEALLLHCHRAILHKGFGSIMGSWGNDIKTIEIFSWGLTISPLAHLQRMKYHARHPWQQRVITNDGLPQSQNRLPQQRPRLILLSYQIDCV